MLLMEALNKPTTLNEKLKTATECYDFKTLQDAENKPLIVISNIRANLG